MSGATSATALEKCFRDEWPRLVGAANRMVADLGAAEEIVSEVLVAALHRWPFTGVADRPGAWLLTATRNRARNHLRDRSRAAAREQLAVVLAPVSEDAEPRHDLDDELALVLTCCHPTLQAESAVAMCLRLVAGLSTQEIARAFLVPVTTIQQRIVRAKKTIASLAGDLAVEDPDIARGRRPSAFTVVYQLFNEGYSATSGETLTRPGLCQEARRLSRLLPDNADAFSLLALVELQASRLAARVDDAGELLALEDPGPWPVGPGRHLGRPRRARRAEQLGPPGPLGLQAAISACHARAATWDDTDWTAISGLYDRLADLSPTPVVALNRAIAVAMRDGPEAGLRLLHPIVAGGELDDSHLLWATRADLNRRAGRDQAAAADYRQALELVGNGAERRYLERRLAQVRPDSVA